MSEDKPKIENDQESEQEQFLFFTIAEIPLALSFVHVKEVMNLAQSILTVPNVKSHVSGVINFHGTVLAILNLAKYLTGEKADRSSFKHILVIQKNAIDAGLLIDDVPKIAAVLEEEILPLSKFMEEGIMDFVSNEIYFEDKNYGVLDAGFILKARDQDEAVV